MSRRSRRTIPYLHAGIVLSTSMISMSRRSKRRRKGRRKQLEEWDEAVV